MRQGGSETEKYTRAAVQIRLKNHGRTLFYVAPAIQNEIQHDPGIMPARLYMKFPSLGGEKKDFFQQNSKQI